MNWIKANVEDEVSKLVYGTADYGYAISTGKKSDGEHPKAVTNKIIKLISQVQKDAIEKTNKRWREKIMRFSMPSCPISSMEYPPAWWYSSFGMAIKEDFMRRISDLLEDKK